MAIGAHELSLRRIPELSRRIMSICFNLIRKNPNSELYKISNPMVDLSFDFTGRRYQASDFTGRRHGTSRGPVLR
ncbi:hypothetical protein Bca4012_005691 [Brassica carinata]